MVIEKALICDSKIVNIIVCDTNMFYQPPADCVMINATDEMRIGDDYELTEEDLAQQETEDLADAGELSDGE